MRYFTKAGQIGRWYVVICGKPLGRVAKKLLILRGKHKQFYTQYRYR